MALKIADVALALIGAVLVLGGIKVSAIPNFIRWRATVLW